MKRIKPMIAVTLVGLCDSVGADPNAAAQSAFVAGGIGSLMILVAFLLQGWV